MNKYSSNFLYIIIIIILLVLIIYLSLYNNLSTSKTYLISYVYYETPMAIENLSFFIKNGIVFDKNVVYNFIIKSKKLSVNIPKYKNINIYKTENNGYDFGGYSNSLSRININDYDYFIFLNDTVRGPFLPRYVNNSWYSLFVNLLNDNIKLVGSSINLASNETFNKHIQSMCFATDIIGIKLLIKNKIFNEKENIKYLKEKGKWNYILKYEIGMSNVITKAGYNISALQLSNNCKQIKHNDIHFENKYFNITLNPLEIMFIKTNRIKDSYVKNYTNWNNGNC